jgi:hypothetical protein
MFHKDHADHEDQREIVGVRPMELRGLAKLMRTTYAGHMRTKD